jgi:hypothetical protein
MTSENKPISAAPAVDEGKRKSNPTHKLKTPKPPKPSKSSKIPSHSAFSKSIMFFSVLFSLILYYPQFLITKILFYISNEEEQKVTPWEVHAKGGIDYNKLIDRFGSTAIDQPLIDRY